MKASDLRLGNRVLYRDGKEIDQWQEHTIGYGDFEFMHTLSEKDFSEYYQPLPVSKDGLRALDCIKATPKDKYGGWFLPAIGKVHYRIKHGEWYHASGLRKTGFHATLEEQEIELAFVHQVQNLYHVLSEGKELVYKK